MKSIATETIMKIFIMIAVILIASSFLLKAFDIDILKFLKEKLGQLGMQPSRALHVWTDPFAVNENKINIFEFHLTSDLRHPTGADKNFEFNLASFPTGRCTMYITDDGDSKQPSGFIYYVNPGSRIQQNKPDGGSCTSIAACIQIDNSGCNIVTISETPPPECSGTNCKRFNGIECTPTCTVYSGPVQTGYYCAKEYNIVDCAGGHAVAFRCDGYEGYSNDATVIDKPFMSSNVGWKCDEGKCDLLVKKSYQLMYGLICGTDGKWYTCKKIGDMQGGKMCDSDGVVWYWKDVTT